jgi:hypothetical protein
VQVFALRAGPTWRSRSTSTTARPTASNLDRIAARSKGDEAELVGSDELAETEAGGEHPIDLHQVLPKLRHLPHHAIVSITTGRKISPDLQSGIAGPGIPALPLKPAAATRTTASTAAATGATSRR